jgi:hypothetical protein
MSTKETSKNVTVEFRNYGKITIPKGTKITHRTATGVDENYHFVDETDWIYENYSSIANILKHDVVHYGINIPKKFIRYRLYKVYKIGKKHGMGGRRKLLGKGLTEDDARKLVNSYPDSNRSMVLFTRQY